jgi:hypothetical protein
MSKRFAFIDNNSGYYYGSVDAADAISACRIMEKQEPHPFKVDFKPVSVSEMNSNESGWHIYEVPEWFDIRCDMDGQSARTTDRIATFPRVEIVKVINADERADYLDYLDGQVGH